MPDRPVRRLAAILSADAAGYSRLMADDESATVETLLRYRALMGDVVARHGGRVVDAPGDNLLAEFATATDALRCAVEIQDGLVGANAELPEHRRMEFRIGLHLGEVRAEDGRLYGDGVNIAARLEGLAEAGGVWVSGAIFEQVQRSAGFGFQDRGPHRVKNIPQSIHAYRVLWKPAGDAQPALTSTRDSTPTVAVLAFTNMSADPDQEFFADGMAEEIINALCHVRGLRVISRTSAFSFKNTDADIAAIGAKLGASAVVEGSVRKAGDRVRITAQLIDVAGGHHLWSERYDRALDDIFEIQDDIAATIVKTIKPKLLEGPTEPLVTRPTENQEAYELYLRASERLARVDRWDTRTAIEMLKDATALDPRFADAWARLGDACCQMNFAFEPHERWHQEAGKAIDEAFELDPDNAEASYAQGRLLWNPQAGFQHRPALRALQRALEKQPGLHRARAWQAIVFMHVGLFEEAERALAEALVAEPGDAYALNILAQARGFQGDFEAAEECYTQSRTADPALVYNYMFSPVMRIYRNDLSGAEAEIEASRQFLKDDPLLDSNEALLWARRGEVAKADAALVRASQERPSLGHIHHTWHHCAAAYASLERPGKAIEKLQQAAATGFPNYLLFRDDPLLAPLQSEPEMQQFLHDLAREWASYRAEFGAS